MNDSLNWIATRDIEQRKKIKRLRDALETLLKVYEDETNIMDKVPVRIQQARTEAWKAIEETR